VLGERITPERAVSALATVQACDAIFNVVPTRWMDADLDHLRVPRRSRYLFGTVKAASAAGLLLGLKRPGLGRLTARSLVAYFVLAIGAHLRIRDRPVRYVPAVAMLGWSALAVRCYESPSPRV
jgi:hypothetical protein